MSKFSMLLLAAIAVVTPNAGVAADVSQKVIIEIREVFINNCEVAPEDLGPRFYQSVSDECIGKASCEVSATDVATEAALQSYGCTHFSVIAVCGPEDFQEYTSDGLADRLSVLCDGP